MRYLDIEMDDALAIAEQADLETPCTEQRCSAPSNCGIDARTGDVRYFGRYRRRSRPSADVANLSRLTLNRHARLGIFAVQIDH